MSLSIVERDASRFNIFLVHFTGVRCFFFAVFPLPVSSFHALFVLCNLQWENNFQVFGLYSLTHKIAKFVLSSATTNNIYVRAASGVLKVHVAVAELSNAAALCKVSFFMLPNSMSVAGSILTFTCTEHISQLFRQCLSMTSLFSPQHNQANVGKWSRCCCYCCSCCCKCNTIYC